MVSTIYQGQYKRKAETVDCQFLRDLGVVRCTYIILYIHISLLYNQGVLKRLSLLLSISLPFTLSLSCPFSSSLSPSPSISTCVFLSHLFTLPPILWLPLSLRLYISLYLISPFLSLSVPPSLFSIYPSLYLTHSLYFISTKLSPNPGIVYSSNNIYIRVHFTLCTSSTFT